MTSAPDRPIFRILLLEDNPADVYLLRHALNDAGVKVEFTVIEDGADGLAFVTTEGRHEASFIPDLAVLDLNLPKGSGELVLMAMRQSEYLGRVPIVVMTSSASPRCLAHASSLGVERFITKPGDLDGFLEIGLALKELLLRTAARNPGLF
jgi:CheY-like chemotaxis protein